jgi:hypothetical protein
MASPYVIATAIESGFGFLLTTFILYLILSQRRKPYHYLFAAFLGICLIWDFGTFLLMVRNTHLNELPVIGYIIGIPCSYLPVLLFHFASLYTGHPIRWLTILGYVLSTIFLILGIFGIYWKVDGVYTYDWGNVFKVAPTKLDPITMVSWFGMNLAACWLVFRAARKAGTRLQRRHFTYVLAGLLVITCALVKVLVVMGVNIPILLPLGMFLVDVFNAIIGIAIIKERLFDITVIVSKGTLYSLLAALLIFIYSLCEHLLVTYVGEAVGENSAWMRIISIAVGIAILMPVKNRLEKLLDGYFTRRKLEF